MSAYVKVIRRSRWSWSLLLYLGDPDLWVASHGRVVWGGRKRAERLARIMLAEFEEVAAHEPETFTVRSAKPKEAA